MTMHAKPNPAPFPARRLVAAALALPLLFSFGCKKEAVPETEVTVQAEHPEQGAIAEHIVADAVLAPLAQAAIAPKISAPVRKFYVQRGSRVKEGELLATLESSDLAAAALDNKGSYMAAEAAYATATKAQVPEDTLKAESDVAQAKANLDLNLSIVKSRKALFAEGAIPGRDLDTAQAALVAAQAAYDAAAKHLDSMHSVSREAALKSAQGQLTSAEGKFKGAQAQVSYSEIRSPHQRRGHRPLPLRRRNRPGRRGPHHRHGHLQPARQDPHRTEPGPAHEARRRGLRLRPRPA